MHREGLVRIGQNPGAGHPAQNKPTGVAELYPERRRKQHN